MTKKDYENLTAFEAVKTFFLKDKRFFNFKKRLSGLFSEDGLFNEERLTKVLFILFLPILLPLRIIFFVIFNPVTLFLIRIISLIVLITGSITVIYLLGIGLLRMLGILYLEGYSKIGSELVVIIVFMSIAGFFYALTTEGLKGEE